MHKYQDNQKFSCIIFDYMENKFLKAIESSYRSYLTSGPRSNQKLKVLHSYIAQTLKDKLGEDYGVQSTGINGEKEFNFEGKYYNKDLDIAIIKDGKAVSAIALKFITSNYKQNGNNYFENMLGETANLRRSDLVYGQIIILRRDMPYLKTGGIISRIEKITDSNLSKYIKLEDDNIPELFHRPDLTFITFVDTGDSEEMVKNIGNNLKSIVPKLLPLVKVSKISKLDNLLDSSNEFINKHNSFENFINAFVDLTKVRQYGK